MTSSRHLTRFAAMAAIAALAAGFLPITAPAQATPRAAASPTAGLYGAADPTYDGVYRQSLAIMGLAANNRRPATAAITWLLSQQCSSGAFQSFRDDLSKPCAAPDPVNFTGPDTNSTATAAMALMSLLDLNGAQALSGALRSRVVTAAASAVPWLGKQQNADGGFPWTSGGASDANSTGLSLSALLTQAPNDPFPAQKKATRYLGSLSLDCAKGGGLAFQGGGAVNASATAQGLVGLSGPMPIRSPQNVAVSAPCANTGRAKAVSYLAKALGTTGTLSSPYGGEADYANTAAAVLGLVAAGQGRAAVARATGVLKAQASAFTTHSGGPDPGALGLLLMVARATGTAPTSFGGVNLVSSLTASLRTA